MTAKSRTSKGKSSRKATDSGARALVIVESPTKVKSISRILRRGYQVRACMGHVRDLPQKEFGVDVEKDFEPVYVLLPGREKTIASLKMSSDKVAEVYLATDLDREGEAIAWHLKQALEIPDGKARRVTFHEITYAAVKRAFEEPRDISMDKVNAQQARRILDRIVGYQLSELLWKKVHKGLSAGRVQSVAVRLIAEREQEIGEFVAEEYWKIHARLRSEKEEQAQPFAAELARRDDKEIKLSVGKEARRVLAELEGETFRVKSVKAKETLWQPRPPLITSTLQQQASTRFRLAPSRTMRIAQELYEGVRLPGEGSVGLITYMRTDAVRVSPQAVKQVRSFIGENFPSEYLPEKPRYYRLGRRAQAAHEAIRPTDVSRTPESLKAHLGRQQFQIYKLVWDQFVASQMTPARFTDTDCHIAAGKYLFRAQGRKLLFEGYLKVTGYQQSKLEKLLPPSNEGEALSCLMLLARQLFSQPPPRYTEASLIKTLEAKGIGRPSTYAPIISTIQKRGYVNNKQGRLYATQLGMVVTDKLVTHFPRIMDLGFTSQMEAELDEVEEARMDWKQVLHDFYTPFSQELKAARELMSSASSAETSDVKCEFCDKPMVYLWIRRNRFLGCSGYPECKNLLPLNVKGEVVKPKPPKETDEVCVKCESKLVIRVGRFGKFLGCSRFPECDYTRSLEQAKKRSRSRETKIPCPRKGCGGKLVKRRGPRGSFYGCTNFPQCTYTAKKLPK